MDNFVFFKKSFYLLLEVIWWCLRDLNPRSQDESLRSWPTRRKHHILVWSGTPDLNRHSLFGRQKCCQLHQYPIWRCLRDSNPRCRRDSPASWPLDEGIIYGGTYRVRTGVICAAGRYVTIYTNAPCGDACGIWTRVLRMKAWGPDQLNESTISIMFGDTCGNRTRITGETAQYLNRWTKVPNLMKTQLI